MSYCIDTSALIEPWVRHYPIDSFPTLWLNIEDLIERGIIIAPDEVLIELQKKEDELYKWGTTKDKLFYAIDDPLQDATTKIMTHFPKLVKARGNKSAADPFVIALAQIENRTVITYEKPSGLKNPHIPDVCKELGINCISFRELIKKQGWVF